MPSQSDLAQLQLWVQEYIRGSFAHSDAARSEIAPSTRLTSLERIDIYRGMYLTRLIEALEIDYPGVRHFLGADKFERIVEEYVEQYPSRSYTLNRLGDRFPQFLTGKSPFLADLARLELALSEVSDAEESPVLTQEAISAVPAEAWDKAVLRPVAAFRLLAFDYPASACLRTLQNPTKRPRRTYVVCYRRDYEVRRLDLTRPAFELLTALAAGTPIGQAVDGLKTPRIKLFEWFREWTSEGLFQSIAY